MAFMLKFRYFITVHVAVLVVCLGGLGYQSSIAVANDPSPEQLERIADQLLTDITRLQELSEKRLSRTPAERQEMAELSQRVSRSTYVSWFRNNSREWLKPLLRTLAKKAKERGMKLAQFQNVIKVIATKTTKVTSSTLKETNKIIHALQWRATEYFYEASDFRKVAEAPGKKSLVKGGDALKKTIRDQGGVPGLLRKGAGIKDARSAGSSGGGAIRTLLKSRAGRQLKKKFVIVPIVVGVTYALANRAEAAEQVRQKWDEFVGDVGRAATDRGGIGGAGVIVASGLGLADFVSPVPVGSLAGFVDPNVSREQAVEEAVRGISAVTDFAGSTVRSFGDEDEVSVSKVGVDGEGSAFARDGDKAGVKEFAPEGLGDEDVAGGDGGDGGLGGELGSSEQLKQTQDLGDGQGQGSPSAEQLGIGGAGSGSTTKGSVGNGSGETVGSGSGDEIGKFRSAYEGAGGKSGSGGENGGSKQGGKGVGGSPGGAGGGLGDLSDQDSGSGVEAGSQAGDGAGNVSDGDGEGHEQWVGECAGTDCGPDGVQGGLVNDFDDGGCSGPMCGSFNDRRSHLVADSRGGLVAAIDGLVSLISSERGVNLLDLVADWDTGGGDEGPKVEPKDGGGFLSVLEGLFVGSLDIKDRGTARSGVLNLSDMVADWGDGDSGPFGGGDDRSGGGGLVANGDNDDYDGSKPVVGPKGGSKDGLRTAATRTTTAGSKTVQAGRGTVVTTQKKTAVKAPVAPLSQKLAAPQTPTVITNTGPAAQTQSPAGKLTSPVISGSQVQNPASQLSNSE